MLRLDVLIREDQKLFLESLQGTVSEHLRVALDDYINKKKKEEINFSFSPQRKEAV